MTGFRETVRAICSGLPGAEVGTPFGPEHDVWRVGGKIFAAAGDGAHGVSLKTLDVETAAFLIDAGIGRKAPYFHRSWVNLPPDAPEEELRHRITTSYDIIRRGLSRKAQAALPRNND